MKYLSAVLALVVVSSLILTPTSRAVAAPAVVAPEEQAICGNILFDLGNMFQPPGTWYIQVANVGPDAWFLCHGTALGFGTYKGCSFCPGGTVTIFGPYFGPVDETFQATPAQVKGAWQVISATKTSGCKQIGL